MNLDAYCFSSTGGRANNEDSAQFHLWPEGGIFVVADGLGGCSDGELASKETLSVFLSQPWRTSERIKDLLTETAEASHHRILALQTSKPMSLRSTLLALCIRNHVAHWVHAGDTRLYYLHFGTLARWTDDHSVAYQRFRAGEISKAQINQDADQALLLRALGEPDRHCISYDSVPLSPGDGFLLCSDGLWKYLYDGEIAVDFCKSDTASQWADHLLLRAANRMEAGNDNLSLITILVS